MDDRKMLMNRLQVCDFILHETALFLDNQPENQEALAYYKKHLALQKETRAEFVEKFGPLSPGDYDGGPRWTWVDNPWPWQNDSEV